MTTIGETVERGVALRKDYDRREVVAGALAGALIRAIRRVESLEARRTPSGHTIEKAEAVAEYRRLAKATHVVSAAMGLECT